MCSPFPLSKVPATVAFALAVFLSLARRPGYAADPSSVLDTSRWVISGEGTVAYFGGRLNDRAIQAWNLSTRVSLLPFGVTRFHTCNGIFDGALEVGLEPTFERFSAPHQTSSGPKEGFANYAGVGLVLRYYFLHFHYGPLVPWIDAGIAPGWSDLKIGERSNETRLNGPFMNRIKGGIGISYFITENAAAYVGLQAQHLSNASLNGPDQNYSLNTPVSFVAGVSWFFR